MKIKVDEWAFEPQRAHDTDAGLDLRSPVDGLIRAGGTLVINTGVHVQLPPGTAGLLVSKSGLNVHHGILSTGLIDEGYTGSIRVKLYNHSPANYKVHRGDKVSQLVILPVCKPPMVQVADLESSSRGDAGFGSTGK